MGDNLPVKYSYGLAIFRKQPRGGNELLIVQKRNTYSYIDFVLGKYNASQDSSIIRLLHGMTRDEKIILLSLNFYYIWFHAFLHDSSHRVLADGINRSFLNKKRRFDKVFIVPDGGQRLKRLINQSRCKDRMWEIPKGRREAHEYDLDCAFREIKEEIGLSPRQYTVQWNIPSFTYSHVDDGVRYVCRFYVATTTADIKPRIMNIHQMMEISDVRWCNKATCRTLLPKGLFQKIERLFKRVRT